MRNVNIIYSRRHRNKHPPLVKYLCAQSSRFEFCDSKREENSEDMAAIGSKQESKAHMDGFLSASFVKLE